MTPYLQPRVSAQPVEDATQQPTPGTLYIAPRNRPIDTTPTAPTLNSATTGDDHLSDPQEDTVLRMSVATLLANDSNATGIAPVGNAEHGTVVLQGNEVVFTPEANYHGPASFAYVVTGQDGGRAFAKSLRIKTCCSPRRMSADSYLIHSKLNAQRCEVRQFLQVGRNLLSHEQGMYVGRSGG